MKGLLLIALACMTACSPSKSGDSLYRLYDEDWQKYATQHHCVKVGDRQAVMTTNGGYAMAQIVYRCDDGEIQIR